MITNKEKQIEVKNRIDSLAIHVPVLEKDILDFPEADHLDKPTRQSVLIDIKSKIIALQEELDNLSI